MFGPQTKIQQGSERLVDSEINQTFTISNSTRSITVTINDGDDSDADKFRTGFGRQNLQDFQEPVFISFKDPMTL